MAHLASSIAVVAAYAVLKTFLGFSTPYINTIAGIALAVLGIRFFVEKPKGDLEEIMGTCMTASEEVSTSMNIHTATLDSMLTSISMRRRCFSP